MGRLCKGLSKLQLVVSTIHGNYFHHIISLNVSILLTAGVGLNLATAFSYMDVATQFVSAVGRDPSGDFILSEAPSLSKTSIQRLEGTATGQVTKFICLLFSFCILLTYLFNVNSYSKGKPYV